jgi:D-3-phosphoglycerate dehydrogenase
MIDVLIPELITGPAVDDLCARFKVICEPELWRDPAELQRRIPGVRALIVRNHTRVTADLLRAASNLLVVGRTGVGLDNVDVNFASSAGIVIAYTPQQNAISVAELTLALMLSLARNIPQANAHAKAGGWDRHQFMGTELYGKTLGIIGFGRIGYLTAARARAFGMDIITASPSTSADNTLLSELRASLVPLDTLLARADFVSCHIPATPQNIGLLNREKLRLMKPTAWLINASRGEILDEPALLEALQSGWLAGAALDVRAAEPPVPTALESLPNVILLPHLGAFTTEAQLRVTRALCTDVARVLDGEPVLNPATTFRLPQRNR